MGDQTLIDVVGEEILDDEMRERTVVDLGGSKTFLDMRSQTLKHFIGFALDIENAAGITSLRTGRLCSAT